MSTIDFNIDDGLKIPIEERSENEVLQMSGITFTGQIETISITTEGIVAANPAFDVTPARYVTGIITDRGVVSPERQAIAISSREILSKGSNHYRGQSYKNQRNVSVCFLLGY